MFVSGNLSNHDNAGVDGHARLPESYHTDRLGVLVTGPGRVFLYWELTGGGLQRLEQSSSSEGGWVIRAHCAQTAFDRSFPIEPSAGSCYIDVPPGGKCRFELGLLDEAGFIRLCESSEADVPVGKPSDSGAVATADLSAHAEQEPGGAIGSVPGLSYDATVRYMGSSAMSSWDEET